MNKNTHRQYTLRNIPSSVDHSLRRIAKASGKSFNQVAVEALARGAGVGAIPKRDFGFIVGSLSVDEAKALEKAIAAQESIDKDLWK